VHVGPKQPKGSDLLKADRLKAGGIKPGTWALKPDTTDDAFGHGSKAQSREPRAQSREPKALSLFNYGISTSGFNSLSIPSICRLQYSRLSAAFANPTIGSNEATHRS
jgi:hypothetical protein